MTNDELKQLREQIQATEIYSAPPLADAYKYVEILDTGGGRTRLANAALYSALMAELSRRHGVPRRLRQVP